MDNPGNVAELPENTESSYGEKLFGAAWKIPGYKEICMSDRCPWGCIER